MHLAQVLITACAFFSIVSATTYQVYVGTNDETKFDPEYISDFNQASDSIEFRIPSDIFHSVTESKFNSPCIPSGYDGEIDITSDQVVSLAPRDENQWWFYSRGESDCTSGMVFAVNPGDAATFDAFKNKAMKGPEDSTSGCSYKDKSCGIR